MYILTHPNLFPSAKALSTSLGELLGRRVSVNTGKRSTSGVAPAIRWGNSNLEFTGDTNLNDREIILTCSNKRRFSEEMERVGIPVVNLMMGTPASFPVVVRTILSGSGGAGIEICRSLEEFGRYRQYHWSPWYNFSVEFGVHVFDGHILKVFKKVRETGEEEEYPIRNLTRGYSFKRVDLSNYPRLPKAIANLLERLPVRFGRVDIAWDTDARLYRVIEMNSAPGVAENPDTLSEYAKHFEEVLRSK